MKPFEKFVLFLLTVSHAVAVVYFVKQWDVWYLWAPLVVTVPVAGWIGVMVAKRDVKAASMNEAN